MATLIDFDSLTLGEVETIETITGSPIDAIMDDGQPRGKVLKVLIWIMEKRNNPKFTIEDAATYTFKQALDLFQGGLNDPKEN